MLVEIENFLKLKAYVNEYQKKLEKINALDNFLNALINETAKLEIVKNNGEALKLDRELTNDIVSLLKPKIEKNMNDFKGKTSVLQMLDLSFLL
jgi:hypothetical protein